MPQALPAQRLLLPGAAARQAVADADERAERGAATWADDEATQRVNLNSASRRRAQRAAAAEAADDPEPTLQEVVVFSRDRRRLRARRRLRRRHRRPGTLHTRLKSFRDIPTADVEVVLPGLKVDRMKSADVVKIVGFILGSLGAAVYSFAFGSGTYTVATVTLISLLAFRAYQTWASIVNAKYTMNEFIRTTLYHRSQDSQRGVLLSVLNSIAQHELREALAFYLLMRAEGAAAAPPPPPPPVAATAASGAGVSVGEAEQLVGDFLEQRLGVRVSLRGAEALERLHRLGLVRRDPLGGGAPAAAAAAAGGSSGGGAPPHPGVPAASVGLQIQVDLQRYTAVPMGDALEILRRVWVTRHAAPRRPRAACPRRCSCSPRQRAPRRDDERRRAMSSPRPSR